MNELIYRLNVRNFVLKRNDGQYSSLCAIINVLKTLLIKKRSVSAPRYQFTHAGQSLPIQPFLEPSEHNLNQKEPYKMPFSTPTKSRLRPCV